MVKIELYNLQHDTDFLFLKTVILCNHLKFLV